MSFAKHAPYQTFLAESSIPSKPEAKKRKGRNKALRNRLVELVICRYYYYSKLKEMQFQKILPTMEDEFLLTVRTMENIMYYEGGLTRLQQLKSEKPAIQYFRNRFPHLVWN